MAIGLRPTFEVASAMTTTLVMERLESALRSAGLERTWSRVAGASSEARSDQSYVLVRHPGPARSTWSPWLHLDIESTADGTRLLGRFMPHPNLWTAYTLGYLGLGVVSFFALVLATSQLLSNNRMSGLWVLLPCALVGSAMWVASQLGQRLARRQMTELRTLVESALL